MVVLYKYCICWMLFASSKSKMNRKLLSVFFSALVCSTLGHEHLKAHELQTRHHQRSHPLGFHSARANPQQCSYVCPVPNPAPENPRADSALSLVFIKETKVYALVSSTVEVAIILQIGEPIALLANGKTGVSVVINIDKQTVVHYPAGSNGNLWKEPQLLLEYLQNLGPLTNVNNWKNGQSSKLTSVTKEVKNIIISVIKNIDLSIAARVESNPDAVISLISVSINALLESSDVVQLLLGKLESSVTVILGGLSKVVNLVVGLKTIEKNLQGGLQSLITDDTNISYLLAQNSGISILLDLLIQVSAHVDLTKVLGNLLQSPEAILKLAVQLDGGIYYGISGITAVIYSVQLYAVKKISLEALIDILIQVQAENGHVKITKETWNNVLNLYFILAQSQASQFNTGSSWSSLNKFFQDIKNEKLVINGINVSAIINVLVSTSGNASLSNVVKILVELKPVVALTQIIATLYFRLIWFVISGQGIVFIHALLPTITITIDFSSTTSILKQILARVNVLQIVSYLLRLDIVGAITHLPVLGPILQALEEILKAVGLAAEVTVASALKAVGSIVGDLKDLILYGLGRGGKAPSDSGIAGLSILGGGISVSIKSSWTISQSQGGSSGGSGSQSGGTTVGGGSSSTSGGSSSGGSGSQSGGTTVGGGSSSSSGGSSSGGSGSQSGGSTVGGGSSSSSGGSSSGGSGSQSGGISIGGGSSSGGSSSGGSGSHSGGISIGGGSISGSGGSSSGGSASHSGGISVGGDSSSSSGGASSGGSGSHSGGSSLGGSSSSSGGSSSGGSGSNSGGISLGGGGSSSGGSSSGGSGSHSGGISIGGGGSSSGGSSSGGSGSHSGGISIGGAGSSSGGSSSGGSGSHSGGVSVGGSSSTGEGGKGSGGSSWSLGNILGGGGSSSSSHKWSLF